MMSPFLQKLCLVAIFVREEEERPQEEEEDDVQIKKLLSKFLRILSCSFPEDRLHIRFGLRDFTVDI